LPHPALAHLPDEKRRELLARGAVLRACTPVLAELLDLEAQRRPPVLDALGGFAMAGQGAAAAPTDSQAIWSLVDRWTQRLQDLLAANLQPDERALIERLKGFTAGAVDEDPFAEIFDIVATAAADLYEADWTEPAFRVASLGNHPRRGRDPYGVSGATVLDPSEVTLKVHRASFGPAAFAAIAPVLVHECACHVPQRSPIDSDSHFAEGFMDWAARYFGRHWASRLPAGLGILYGEHEERLYHAIATSMKDLGTARARGRRVAQHLSLTLERRHGYDRARAQLAVARFAIRLNVIEPARPTDKDAFVSSIRFGEDAPIAEPLLSALQGLRSAAEVL
jgi:hypothetical protein